MDRLAAAKGPELRNQRRRWVNGCSHLTLKFTQKFHNFPQDDTPQRAHSYDVIKVESDASDKGSDSELKNKQIKVLQETIRNLQRKLIETNTKEKQNEAKIGELEEAVRESNVKELLLRTKIANARTLSATIVTDDTSETSASQDLVGIEPQLISLATAFLVIHPKGAELESLVAYMQQFMPTVAEADINDVLFKHEKLFTTESSKWIFNGFKKLP